MKDDAGSDEARVQGRARGGAATGALCGSVAGVVVWLALPPLGLAIVALGALIGAVGGRAFVETVDLEEWEPGPGHSFVGARAPDADAAVS